MLDQRIVELINAGIDGELSSSERRELEAVLDSSPEAVTYRVELLELNNVFHHIPELDPPPALVRNILDQVQLPAKRKFFKLPSPLTGLNPVAGGLAFAAGLVLAVVIYENDSRNVPQQDTVSMVGTMVASDQLKVTGEEDRLLFDLDGLSGTVTSILGENGQTLEFKLESNKSVEIEIDLEQAGLVVIGFAQDDLGNGNFIETLELLGGTMRMVHQGSHHFVVFLRQLPDSKNHGKDIRIGISQDGQRVYEGTLGSLH